MQDSYLPTPNTWPGGYHKIPVHRHTPFLPQQPSLFWVKTTFLFFKLIDYRHPFMPKVSFFTVLMTFLRKRDICGSYLKCMEVSRSARLQTKYSDVCHQIWLQQISNIWHLVTYASAMLVWKLCRLAAVYRIDKLSILYYFWFLYSIKHFINYNNL